MGYATIKRVAKVATYAEALAKYEKTAPIRGRVPEVRPLGDRKDCDKYQIRKNGEDFELVLYKTAVITLKPSGEIVVFTDGYDTVSTHQFISWILGFNAQGVRRTTVLTIDGNKYTIKNGDKLTLTKEDGRWVVHDAKQQERWILNRKAVTNVRARYGEFYKYFKAFVNLRTERVKLRYYTEFDGVVIPREEYASLFGTVANLREYACMNKRGAQTLNWSIVRPEAFKTASDSFEALIRADQPEDMKHTNFYKAALALVLKEDNDQMDIRADEVRAKAKHLVPLLDEVLFMRYADEVLVREMLPMGKVSTNLYESWMKTHG